jgi:uncharacterized membrane protein (DUF2068 family)
MPQGDPRPSPNAGQHAGPAPSRAPLAPPWRRRRTHYLRALAILLLISGLWQCSFALGAFTLDGRSFLDLRGPARNALTAFAVLDLVAAVGLWLGAVWGPVLFAVDTIAAVALRTFSAETHGSAPIMNTLWLLLLAGLVVFTVLVRLEASSIDATRRRERKANRRRSTPAP